MSRVTFCILAFVLALSGCSQPSDTPAAPSQKVLQYRNEKYGFVLAFNERWAGYAVEDPGCFLLSAQGETRETHPCLVITLPTDNEEWNTVRHPSANGRFEALAIGIYTTDQWRRTDKEVSNGVRKFATKVITFDAPGEQPSDVDLRDLDIPDVIDSLESWVVD